MDQGFCSPDSNIWNASSIFGREKNKGKSFAKVACQDYAVPVLWWISCSPQQSTTAVYYSVVVVSWLVVVSDAKSGFHLSLKVGLCFQWAFHNTTKQVLRRIIQCNLLFWHFIKLVFLALSVVQGVVIVLDCWLSIRYFCKLR